MSSEFAIALSFVLVITAATALFSKSVSISLIMLFYASLALGVIFASYGSILVGVLEIITFAGAVSVMLLTTVLMTGESKLELGANKLKISLAGASVMVAVVASFTILLRLPTGSASVSSQELTNLFQFVWDFRPWDLLILLIVFTSAMVVVVNLFSRESQ